MSDIIKKIYNFKKFDLLKTEVFKIVDKLDSTQFALQINSEENNWDQSSGWLTISDELKFNKIHPSIKGSVLEDYILSSPVKLFRTRIMILNPNGKSNFTIHKDPTPRLHLPILTNDQNIFLFPDDNYISRLEASGDIYWCDTTRMHTFINYSKETRIHIVSTIIK